MGKKLSPHELEPRVRELLRESDDSALLPGLQELAQAEPAFGGLTPLWGPLLYRRNRLLFTPFIQRHFSPIAIDPTRKGPGAWKLIHWKDHQKTLDPWLEEADRLDDVTLFSWLFMWKHGRSLSDKKNKTVFEELRRRLPEAGSDALQLTVLRKFDLPCSFDEDEALEIYRLAPRLSSDYLLRHLRREWQTFGGDEKRSHLYTRLIDAAEKQGDGKFGRSVYRRTVPLEEWEQDAHALCRRFQDPGELAAALQEIQPEGWFDYSVVFHKLAAEHGRRVVPYLLKNLEKVRRWWGRDAGYKNLLKLAHDQDWQELWIGLLRVCAREGEYNTELAAWLKKENVAEPELRRRLMMLCGISREWNFAGFSAAAVHALNDENALLLYERFPDLMRGPYRLHLQATRSHGYEQLVERLIANREEDLIDFLASRFAMQVWSKPARKTAHRLSVYYLELREESPEFTRRAANVLGMVPAYSAWNYKKLIEDNRLARLLLERSDSFYLGDPGALQDLVEAPEIHVQMMAYRALALDDDRARAGAEMNLDVLLGTLLRPLHRRTRQAAFGALANAATTPAHAARVLARAREALDLPDKRYPKEDLVQLIAGLLQRWPELRAPEEQPVIYGEVA